MASGKAPLSPNGDDADVCLFGSDENIPMNIDQPLRRHLASEFTTVVKPSEEEVDALDSTSANLQPGQEHMKVFLRIRPFTENELRQKESQNILKVDNSNVLSVNAPKDSVTYKNYQHGGGRMTYKFTFSKIFGPECSQKTLFNEAMGGIVKDTVDGQNCLLFTYGVTNAGKTYTIQGNQSDEGILPRSLDVIFNSVVDKQYESMNLKPRCFQDVVRLSEEQEASEAAFKRGILRMANNDEPESSVLIATSTLGGSQMTLNSTSDLSSTSAASQMLDVTKSSDVTQLLGEVDSVLEEARVSVETQGQIRFSIWVSYTEIYNELVYDLLAPMSTGMDRKRPSLKLAEDKSGNVYVKGLKEVKVNSADEAYKVLCIGKKNLQVATTKLNHSSSRSHCIFTVKILRVVDKDRPHVCRVSKLSFCDLAGSERYSKTQNTGQRLKEATNINTSLLTLGRCIHSLRFNQLHKDHPNMVPYRDSKLTKLLQSFFSGKGKASMIVNVSPCASYFDETLHGLKFSAIAKQVTVQQVKEPEMKPPKRPYRHRSSKPAKISLMLKAAPPPRTRETLAWEEAPAAKRRLQEAAKIPLPEDDDDDLDEEEEEEEEDNDEENEELRELVAQLTQQLKEEKKKLLLTETRIREEVSSEFAAQLIDIENQRAEDMREERHAADEYAEKRLELFSQSVKKSRKRMRIRDDDDDDTALGAQLQLANAKAQEQDRALDELREQLREASSDIGKLKGALKASACERAKTIEENSKLQFRLSDANTTIGLLQEKEQMLEVAEATVCDLQQQLIETSQLVTANASASNEVCKPQEKDSLNSSSDSFLHSEIVNQLQKQLEEARDNVERQEAEIKELNEMLEEAGETFEQKEEEIGKLKAALSEPDENEQALAELAQLSEESKLALQEAKEMLGSRDNYIRELEAQLRRLQGSALYPRLSQRSPTGGAGEEVSRAVPRITITGCTDEDGESSGGASDNPHLLSPPRMIDVSPNCGRVDAGRDDDGGSSRLLSNSACETGPTSSWSSSSTSGNTYVMNADPGLSSDSGRSPRDASARSPTREESDLLFENSIVREVSRMSEGGLAARAPSSSDGERTAWTSVPVFRIGRITKASCAAAERQERDARKACHDDGRPSAASAAECAAPIGGAANDAHRSGEESHAGGEARRVNAMEGAEFTFRMSYESAASSAILLQPLGATSPVDDDASKANRSPPTVPARSRRARDYKNVDDGQAAMAVAEGNTLRVRGNSSKTNENVSPGNDGIAQRGTRSGQRERALTLRPAIREVGSCQPGAVEEVGEQWQGKAVLAQQEQQGVEVLSADITSRPASHRRLRNNRKRMLSSSSNAPADAEKGESGPADAGKVESGPADAGKVESGSADAEKVESGPARRTRRLRSNRKRKPIPENQAAPIHAGVTKDARAHSPKKQGERGQPRRRVLAEAFHASSLQSSADAAGGKVNVLAGAERDGCRGNNAVKGRAQGGSAVVASPLPCMDATLETSPRKPLTAKHTKTSWLRMKLSNSSSAARGGGGPKSPVPAMGVSPLAKSVAGHPSSLSENSPKPRSAKKRKVVVANVKVMAARKRSSLVIKRITRSRAKKM